MYKGFNKKKIKVPEHKYAVKIGDKFGKLTVISCPYYLARNKTKGTKYIKKYQFVECSCECGNQRTCIVYKLKNNKIPHCQNCAKASSYDKTAKPNYNKKGHKECYGCNKFYDIKYFYKNCGRKDGLNTRCKNCEYISRIKNTYDIDITHLMNQNLECEICKKKLFMPNDGNKYENILHLDHNHSTGKLRGILCRNCNTAIGMSNEDILILKNIISYLEKHN